MMTIQVCHKHRNESGTPCPYCQIDILREALHLISLGSQNSMSSKDECGKIARDALQRAGGGE